LQQIIGAGTTSKITVVGNNFSEYSVASVVTVDADYLDGDASSDYFRVSKPFSFPSGFSSGTASAGGTTPPANVQGYLPLYLSGTLYKIPFYNA
jgi:hypothetical protein